MKVMMVQIPHFYGDNRRPPTLYPLGIGYLASALKSHHELVPMDLWADNANVDKAMRMIGKDAPDVFCVSVYSTQYPYFKELAAAIKGAYPNTRIIAGGPGATFSYRTFLEKTCVDFCVIGEGEVTLKELLANMDDPGEVEGIAYKKDGSVFVTERRKQIADIDSLPAPDRSFFDIERYIANNIKMRGNFKKSRVANIIAGRGCPYSCTFCSKTFSGIRLRSIAGIAKEIENVKEAYNINAVEFNDELVVVAKKRIMELCASLKKLDVKWGCQGRIDLVDEEILKAMKSANCLYIGYGVESYTQNILDSMKKQTRIEEIVPVIKMTKAIGLTPIIQYMYGFPGEDDSSIEKTYDFFKEIDSPYMGFTTTPLPGTEIYNEALGRGLIGDEEEYLKKITAGYNLFSPVINMTSFNNEEFVSKKLALMKKVNRRYYSRHPLVYLRTAARAAWQTALFQFSNPGRFLRRLMARLSLA